MELALKTVSIEYIAKGFTSYENKIIIYRDNICMDAGGMFKTGFVTGPWSKSWWW